MSLTTRELIQHASAELKQAGCESPRLDAELLLMFVWSIERTDLIMRSQDQVPEAIQQQFNSLIQRRVQREPLAYIVGHKEFWSRSFAVSPDVLIPRPETEHLIEAVLEHFPDRQGNYHFCDIGTGSGIIAITLACEYANAHILATDISTAALNVAQDNATAHHIEQRISFKQGDMLQALPADQFFNLIISNPPYVTKHEMPTLEQELSHEPRHALTDEADGLTYLTTILTDACNHLQPDGLIILETGPCGLPATPPNLSYKYAIHDLAGHARGGIYRATRQSQHG